MELEILGFEQRPCKTKIGCLLIKYFNLVLKCDLVYHPQAKRAWVRMPERWLNNETKHSYCYWPTREISDEFQKELLKKLFDKYDLTLEKIQEIHKSDCDFRSQQHQDKRDAKKNPS